MKIVNGFFTNEIEIEKSRFIASLMRVNSNEEANDFLSQIKKKYWDATHNCLAIIIGKNGEIMRSSDDGEPSRTAGIPMLEVLKKNNITDTICIVTRYFGGIKLGAGGLIRAYTKAVSEALKKANFIEIRLLKTYDLLMDYATYNTLLSTIKSFIIDSTFTNEVRITIAIEDLSLLEKINDLALGKITITYQKDISRDVVL